MCWLRWQKKKEEITMASIRFIQNVNLKVTYEGEDTMVPFSAGDTFKVVRIEIDDEDYNNIYMPDGSVLMGVAGTVFETKRVPVTRVEVIEPEPDNALIVVEEAPVDMAVFNGTILSESESYDTEPFAAENERYPR